jgi:hypothetical protein
MESGRTLPDTKGAGSGRIMRGVTTPSDDENVQVLEIDI